MKITRKQAIRVMTKLLDQDGIEWVLNDCDLYDEEADDMPDMYDIFEALGVTEEEVNEGCGIKQAKP